MAGLVILAAVAFGVYLERRRRRQDYGGVRTWRDFELERRARQRERERMGG